ncbi:MAG: alpha/beta fold hydrolase [bacterium]
MKKIDLVLFILCIFQLMFSADLPLIFLHGNLDCPIPKEALQTWNNSSSVMTRLIASKYNGYTYGLTLSGSPALYCIDTTQLRNMSTTKLIYNFSYYNEDSTPGAIGSNGMFYPVSYKDDYIKNISNASWGKKLADFIDKVLSATGASKVDIVAHSMGGVVARSAICFYGSSGKVRKLLTIGTPNHAYQEDAFLEAFVANVIPGYANWQKKGELLELGVNYLGPHGGVLFKSQSDPNMSATYLDWLGLLEPKVSTCCIAGKKEAWYSSKLGDNDGIVKTENVKLDHATFNPIIYASHSYDSIVEEALTTCTYTYEFIKKWLIDDDTTTFINAQASISNTDIYQISGSRTTRVKLDADYSKILSVRINEYRPDGTDGTRIKAFPLYLYTRAFPGDPVFSTTWPTLRGDVDYYFNIRVQDMNHGDCNKLSLIKSLSNYAIPYINIPFIYDFYKERGSNITWSSNDKAVMQKIYYKKDEDNWVRFATLDGNARSYNFNAPEIGSYEVKILYFLDNATYIQAISNSFVVSSEITVQLKGYYTGTTKGTVPHVFLSYYLISDPDMKNNYYYFYIYRNGVKIATSYSLTYQDNISIAEGSSVKYYVTCYDTNGGYKGLSPTITVFNTSIDGCPYLYVKENGIYEELNTIMYYGDSNAKDYFKFNVKMNDDSEEETKQDKNIELAISENEIETNYLDALMIKEVRYDTGYSMAVNQSGEYLFWREKEPIDSIINRDGAELLPLLESNDGLVYNAPSGDTITIYRTVSKSNKGLPPIVSGIGEKRSLLGTEINASMIIQYWDGVEWNDIGKLSPRENIYDMWNKIPEISEMVRLIIVEDVKIDMIIYPIEEQVKYKEYTLKIDNPLFNNVNVSEKIKKEDNNYLILSKGDTLYFSVHSKSIDKKEQISYILITDGYYKITSEQKGIMKMQGVGNIIIKDNYILLTDMKTEIDIEIYDILGKRVINSPKTKEFININSLPNGIYFLKAKTEEKSSITKFELIR